MTLYKVVIRPVILYACETWPLTEGDEDKIAIFERRIFGPKRNNIKTIYCQESI